MDKKNKINLFLIVLTVTIVLFADLDMYPAINLNETYDNYVLRRKKTNFIIQKYKQVGREIFENTFPDGVTIEAMDDVTKQS